MIPLSAPQLVMGPLGGKLADYFGASKLLVVGIIFLIIGIGDSNNLHIESALVLSIDYSFRFFTIFFVIALILGLVLLKSKEKNDVDE